MKADFRQVLAAMMIVLGLCSVVGASDLSWAAIPPQPLGEWSTECNAGFKLSAMPSSWEFFPGQSSLVVTVHTAIDFELLSTEVYSGGQDSRQGETVFDLTGFDFMVLEAEIRYLKTGRVVQVLPAVYRTDDGNRPVVFEWNGRTKDGRAVKPGMYEIEVRGRFVPTWAGVRADDGYGYRDFDGWSIVEEACRRTLRVEVSEKAVRNTGNRGTSCAAPPATYYESVDATNATDLRSTLHEVIDDHARFPYSSTSTDTWDVLNNADENPSNPSEVLTVYKNEAHADGCSSGCSFDREHMWASSYGFSENSGNGRIPFTDCYNLHAANGSYNSSRGNKPFNDCTSGCTDKPTDLNNGFGGGAGDVDKTKGSSTPCGSTPDADDIWEVWDHRKGDVARTILYMDIRYEGGTGEQDLVATSDLALMMVDTTSCEDGYQDPAYHGVLSTLLAWHAADPVDSDEQRRNDQVWCYQGNRNPFVDHPEWVDCLYNNNCTGNPAFDGIDAATDLDPCADTGVAITWTDPTVWNDECSSGCNRSFVIKRDGVAISSGGCAGSFAEGVENCTDTTGANNTTVNYTVEAIGDDGDRTDGGTSADAGDFVDDLTAPVITAGPSALAGATTFTVTWTTDESSDSYLEWGTNSGIYTENDLDTVDVTSHSLYASGLSITTEYFYRVCSTDPCGNGPSCSGEGSVTTTEDCDPGSDTGVFINEFHYDNTGDDAGEFVEVAGPAGTDLRLWEIALYNGSGGAQYDRDALGAVIDDEGTGYGAISISYPTNGLQNGPAEGIALIDASGSVVQFLCYEGTVTATSGVATGLTCTDIGLSEDGSTMVGHSLQLAGGPSFVYEGYTWSGPSAASPGSLNSGQTMACGPVPPSFGGIVSASDLDPCQVTGVRVDWTSPSDWNDDCASGCSRGFHIYRDGLLITTGGCADPQAEVAVSCVDSTGTVGVLHSYAVEAFNDDGDTADGGAVAGARDATNDGIAPVITTGPTATPSSASFSVSWQTDEVSDSSLEWGTVTNVYTDATSDAADVLGHSLTATGLIPNETYYYRVCSTDPCGQGPTCSAEETVDTTSACTPGDDETPVFINEFHYDNDGTDTGEFVEIAGPAGTDLGGATPWKIEFYSGSTPSAATEYKTIDLSGTIASEGSGYGALAFFPGQIQNGSNDGIALLKPNAAGDGYDVVQFLCYEGAATGAAGETTAGMTCTDVGVDEPKTTPIGHSLQLKGGPGFVYEAFSWNDPSVESPGFLNAGQDMSCDPPPDQLQFFTATSISGQVLLELENAASYPAGGTTRICRDPSSYPTDPDTCTIAGASTTVAGSDGSYGSLVDTTAMSDGSTYFYSAWTISSGGEASPRETVAARPFDTTGPVQWTYHSGASSLAPPGLWPGAIGTGAVFAVANDNSLHGMNPSGSGGQWPGTAPFDWRPTPMNGPAHQRPPVVPVTLGSGSLVVFLGAEDGRAYAVDAYTGNSLWPANPPLAGMITASVAGQFTAFGGAYDLLFVGSRDAGSANSMFGLHLADGSNAWTFDNGGTGIGIISSGATVDYATNRLYFTSREYASGAGTVWCLTFTDGGATLLWERALGDIDGAPILYDGRVYVGTNAGDVHALDAATGLDVWSAPYSTADGAIKGHVFPGFSALPRRLVLSTSTKVWALTDNGVSVSLDWQQPGVAGPSIPLALEGVGVFVGSTDGGLYQLNEATGGVMSSVVLGDGTAVIGSPAYDYFNGMAYVGSESGATYGVTLPLP